MTEKTTSFPVVRAHANYGLPTLFRASGASIYLGTRVKAQWPIKELQLTQHARLGRCARSGRGVPKARDRYGPFAR
jgi:hypothetical protein